MKYTRFFYLVVIVALLASLLPLARSAQAQTTLPTAVQVASQIKVGWNIGNTLEAMCSETIWGNPMVTQQLINSVKAAGFNAIRIPIAWDCRADQTTHVIDAAWMARVKEVVDYGISQNMYVIINIHWDGGWLENNPTYAAQAAVNVKQNAYWTQIANYFKTYDEHLLFAGTNEVHFDYGEPTAEHIEVHQSYLQTFVNAVRATGGNNASRTLVVQTYNTNMWHGLRYFTMPTDTIANRLMVETHYYDPYDYTLNSSGPCLAWGAPYTQYPQCAWAQEAYVDDLFNQVKTKWVDQGFPVIIGEYTVSKRPNLDLASRLYWFRYINTAATANGIKTFLWDTGDAAGVFNRNTGAITDQDTLNAIITASSPCTTCTATPTKTPTRTATITMTPCSTCGNFVVSIKGGGTDNNQQTGFSFSIKNAGTNAVSSLSTRIYFTTEGGNAASAYALEKYYDGSGAATIGSPIWLSGNTYYFPISFGAASLAPGATWEFQMNMHLGSWGSSFDGSNDWYHTGYAMGALPAAFAATNYVPVYINGGLVLGIEPGMGATNTPGPSFTPTRTPTLTPVVTTLTPTRTLTPTLTPVITLTPTRTNTPTTPPAITNTPTNTPTRTLTSVITNTRTRTPTRTPTGPTATRTRTPTRTRTNTPGTPVITLTPTRTNTPTTPPVITNTPTRTLTPVITNTPIVGACSPVTSTITAPFTFDGAGTFCWQSSSLGGYMNSWNTTSVSINGVNITNVWMGSGSYPAKIGGFWYVSYNSGVAWGHFEAK